MISCIGNFVEYKEKKGDNPKLVPLRVRIILQNYFNFAKK